MNETPRPGEEDLRAARELKQKGIEAHDAGDYELAIELYDKALRRHPLDAFLYSEKAFTYTAVGDQTKALDNITRALALDPEMDGAHVQKATILDDLGYPQASLEIYDQLLAAQPGNFTGLLNQGITYFRLGRLEEAEAAFKKAQVIEPGNPSSYLRLSQLASARGHDYEEAEYLEKFLEVGQEDSRRESVKKRIEELNDHQVNIDPDAPYPQIASMERLARVTWHTRKHRETFPEAKGYFPSFEEEKAIYQELVLPSWRAEKEKDPEAAHPFYDLLLAIDEAGFFEEYVYYTHGEDMGKPGQEWLARSSQRMERFLSWAKDKGLTREASDSTEKTSALDIQQFFRDVQEIIEASELGYVIDFSVTDGEAETYLAAEADLFRNKLDLTGDDEVACGSLEDDMQATASAVKPVPSMIRALRCHRPVGETWDRLSRFSSRYQIRLEDLSPAPRLSIRREGNEIDVKSDHLAWSIYALAKAAWKNEPELRARYGNEETYKPSILEEVLALGSAIQTYANTRAGDEDEEPAGEDPTFEALLQVAEKGHLPGYVLFEVLFKTYGVELRSLSPYNAELVEAYLRELVLK